MTDADFVSLYIREPFEGEPRIPIPAHCGVVAVSPFLKQLIVRLRTVSEDGDAERSARIGAVIADELGDLVSANLHLPVPADRRAARVARALIEDPADPRELADWARIAGASGRTLTRIFLRETGLSFAEWRQRCRLMAALEMLSAGRSVTAVAFDTGYRSSSAFAAAFSRAFGSPPREFMRTADRA
jgi:AraC-like DNA-binding protein